MLRFRSIAVSSLIGFLSLAAIVAGMSKAQAQTRVNPLLGPKTWAFQLQNLEADQQAKIAASPYDMVVIDFARGASIPQTPLTRAEVEKMKVKPDGSKRLVIAYMSIGETENYRFYWQNEWNKKRPDWMGAENKDWKGNYLAKYWLPVWQNIIFGSTTGFADKIVDAGFDGFYLDRVDAYYYYGDTKERRKQMVDFVAKVSKHLRAKKPDIAILAQNAEELLDYPEYVEAIDGIAKESLLYGIKGLDKLNPKDDIEPSTALLLSAKKAGKAIFGIEYLKNQSNIIAARQKFKDLGFVLYVGQRGLTQLAEFGANGFPVFPKEEGDTLEPSAGKVTKTAAKKK